MFLKILQILQIPVLVSLFNKLAGLVVTFSQKIEEWPSYLPAQSQKKKKTLEKGVKFIQS